MPTYNSPGVYVEDVPPISRPISGVSTSTPGFIGLVQNSIPLPYRDKDGVLKWLEQSLTSTSGTVYRISSWADYVQLFGDFVGTDYAATATTITSSTKTATLDGQRYLAHAVYGFFNNGGTNCYVVRIVGERKDSTDKKKDPEIVVDASQLDKALTALAAFDDISTVSFPGQTDCHGQLADHATALQRFAILDMPRKDVLVEADFPRNSTYAGAYFPWLKVVDPAEAMTKNGDGVIAVPPSGHIAGIYARSDAARGAYKAPANEALMGVNALSVNITKSQQDFLNVAGINAIRQLNGALRVWGARTVGKNNGEYRYISTRRYFNYLRQSIDSGTQFVVFEPHTPALWQRVIRTLTDFLTNEWRAGALFGETAKQAFFIKCDAETNPPSTRDQGQLIVEIGVAIVKPAEFVIFRIQQTSGS